MSTSEVLTLNSEEIFYREDTTELFEILFDNGTLTQIGNYWATVVQDNIRDQGISPSTNIAVSKTKLAAIQCVYPTHQERYENSLECGRRFIEIFNTEPIEFLISIASTMRTGKESGYPPNEDPNRQQGLLVLALDLRPMHAARTMSQYMEANNISNIDFRVWAADVDLNGEILDWSYHGERNADVQPINFNQVVIGISNNFSVIRYACEKAGSVENILTDQVQESIDQQLDIASTKNTILPFIF
jgi:hypothetical protein